MKRSVSKYTKSFVLSAILFVIISSCNSKRLEGTKELSREIKASQIIRVTNTQLVYTVDEWGKKLSKIAEKSLQKELSKNPDNVGTICKDLTKIPLISALQKEYGVHIQLLGAGDSNNPDLYPKEKELLGAYLYSAKNKAAASDNVQQLNDTLFVYNVLVSPDDSICKACMTGQETTFALWRLVFDKKEIIRKLDAKMLKK